MNNFELPNPTNPVDILESQLATFDESKFGGFYFTDNGNMLNVNQLANFSMSSIEFSGIGARVHPVKHSLKKLHGIRDSLSELMIEHGIQSLSVNIPLNKVEVHLYKYNDKFKPGLLNEAISDVISDQDAIFIIVDEQPIRELIGDMSELTEKLAAGTYIKDGSALVLGSNKRACSSMTCGALLTIAGTSYYGFVSCGHGWLVNDLIRNLPPNSSSPYYTFPPYQAPDSDLITLGDCIAVCRTGSVDCSFTPRANADLHTYGATLSGISASYQGGVPAIGKTVWNSGIWSNGSGTVLNNDMTITTSSGDIYTKVIQCTNAAQEGDSGGPLFYEPFSGQTTKSLCGITAAGDGTNSYFTRFSENRSYAGFSMYGF